MTGTHTHKHMVIIPHMFIHKYIIGMLFTIYIYITLNYI